MTDQSESAQTASARTTSAAVIGGGPAGLVAALALAYFSVPTVLVAPRPGRIDNRTTALMGHPLRRLKRSAFGHAAALTRRRCG